MESMKSSPETLRSVEIVDVTEGVEFDAERALFQATFDSDRDPISLVVIAVVAAVARKSPRELTPLQSVIDTDALHNLFSKSSANRERCGTISFCYEGFEVTVCSEGRLEVDQIRKDGVRIDGSVSDSAA